MKAHRYRMGAAIAGMMLAPLFAFAQTALPNITLICRSGNITRVHIDIVGDGRSLAIIDRVADAQDIYPIDGVTRQMIDRVVDEHMQSDVYRCTVVYLNSGR